MESDSVRNVPSAFATIKGLTGLKGPEGITLYTPCLKDSLVAEKTAATLPLLPLRRLSLDISDFAFAAPSIDFAFAAKKIYAASDGVTVPRR